MNELIQLYFRYFGFFDVVCWCLGILAFWLQFNGFRQARSISTTRGAGFDKKFNSLVSSLRYGTLAVDALPLIGLLGTVGALLVTFSGMDSGIAIGEIIHRFAPGLTSTVSGLLLAISNLAFLNLWLLPEYQRIKGGG